MDARNAKGRNGKRELARPSTYNMRNMRERTRNMRPTAAGM
jgi:hypothetical protein